MRQRDDEVGAGVAKLRRPFRRNLHRVEELHVAGARLDHGAGRRQPDDPDGVVAEGRRPCRLGARHRRAGGIDDVRRDHGDIQGRGRLPSDLRTEVEFVVPQRNQIEAGLVHQVDHMGALVEARQDGRRDEVAGVGDQNVVSVGANDVDRADDAGHSAAAVVLLHPIDVVDVDDRQRQRFSEGAAGRDRAGGQRQRKRLERRFGAPETNPHFHSPVVCHAGHRERAAGHIPAGGSAVYCGFVTVSSCPSGA